MATENSSATGKSLVKPLVGKVIPASEVRKSKKYDFSKVVDAMHSLKEGLALPCTLPDSKAAIYLQTFILSLNRKMDGWKYSAQRVNNVVYCSRQKEAHHGDANDT